MSYTSPPPPSPPEPPAYDGGQGYGPMPETNQKAVWALVLGILGLVCCGLASIAALVLGIQAKSEIEASRGTQTGAGQAQAGFVLGIVGIALWVIGLVAYLGVAVVAVGG